MFLYRIILGIYTIVFTLAQRKVVSAQIDIDSLDPIPTTEQVLPTDTLIRNFGSLSNVVATAFNVVIAASGVIFIILILVGGTQYLTAGGNEESLTKAKSTMVQSIIGLIIVLSTWAIGSWVLGTVGLTSSDDYEGGGGYRQ